MTRATRGGRLVGNLSSSAQHGQGQGTAELFVSVPWRRERVTVAGELDIATAPELERALRRPAVDPAVVFLDLRELEFMDSSGLHVILAADRRVRSAGGHLVIVRGPAQVDRLLALGGIDCQLELVDQPPAAAAREDVAA